MAIPFPTFTPTWHNTSYSAIDPRTNSNLSAAGKTVLITGGARGIGARIATSFATAGAGRVILLGRSIASLKEQQKSMENEFPNTTVHIFSADVADTEAIQAVFHQISTEIGPVDILVSNAGYLPDPKPVAESHMEDWWRAFQTNTLGAMNLVRGFLSNTSLHPILINITTGITHIPAIPGFSSYSASKEAFLRALDFVAVENPALKVFHLHPGVVATDMHAKSGMTFMPVDDGRLIQYPKYHTCN